MHFRNFTRILLLLIFKEGKSKSSGQKGKNSGAEGAGRTHPLRRRGTKKKIWTVK